MFEEWEMIKVLEDGDIVLDIGMVDLGRSLDGLEVRVLEMMRGTEDTQRQFIQRDNPPLKP